MTSRLRNDSEIFYITKIVYRDRSQPLMTSRLRYDCEIFYITKIIYRDRSQPLMTSRTRNDCEIFWDGLCSSAISLLNLDNFSLVVFGYREIPRNEAAGRTWDICFMIQFLISSHWGFICSIINVFMNINRLKFKYK